MERDALTQRYRHLKVKLRKTHLCGFYFRQRCLHFKEHCYHAHGHSDLVRMSSHQILALRQELFNIKQTLGTMKNTVLFNEKSKRFEIYKSKDFNKLREIRAGGTAADGSSLEQGEDVAENGEDNEEEAEEGEEAKVLQVDPLKAMKRSLGNLNLDDCRIIERIEWASTLNKFDMNKALDSDDEGNLVKRKSRTKPELNIVRPWQNTIMVNFLKKLFEEAGERVLLKSEVLEKYNESGVPITWPRIATFNVFFEKKTILPPYAPTDKKTVLLPLKSPKENLEELEQSILGILTEKIDQL